MVLESLAWHNSLPVCKRKIVCILFGCSIGALLCLYIPHCSARRQAWAALCTCKTRSARSTQAMPHLVSLIYSIFVLLDEVAGSVNLVRCSCLAQISAVPRAHVDRTLPAKG